ncbi:Bifunctional monothiol glutaredoxin-S16 [Nymphaea thermarum]|nr:Bifunctional monothiol glutaredoxin-S16 [Nymphaea thermarum]
MATVTNFFILSSPKTKRASLSPTATILPSLPAATAAFPAKPSWGIRRVCGKPNFRERELHSGPRRVSVVTRAVRKLGESETIAIEAESTGQVPSLSGVYAVYDNEGTLQFIGISRNIAASVSTHLKTVRHLCSSVKSAGKTTTAMGDRVTAREAMAAVDAYRVCTQCDLHRATSSGDAAARSSSAR